MLYKVTADAHYEFEVEAEDEELAIAMAAEELCEGTYPIGDPASLLDWEATPTEETHHRESKAKVIGQKD